MTDRVVANPPLGLLDGQEVKIVQPVAGYRPASEQPAKPWNNPPPTLGQPQ
jgi:hypothetical protein